MALSAARLTPVGVQGIKSYPQKGSTTIYNGALVVLDSSGYCKPGVTGVSLIACGVACLELDQQANSGSDGDEDVPVREGVFGFVNSAGGDEIGIDDIGKICYVVDDQTVALTSNGGARSAAGRVAFIGEDALVYVEVSARLSRAIVDEPAPSPVASYTQTYATADRTMANLTSATLTDSSGGSADTTVAAITEVANAGSADTTPVKNGFADVIAQINALRVDLIDVKQAVNAVIDDLQTAGILS